jgi:hypothetical protein
MDERKFSRTFPRTVDGLRVAVAGLPASMPVQLGDGVEISAATIADLRLLDQLPHPLEIVVPYHLEPDTVILVNRSEVVGER